jgi:probable O-glycosylation ligase (exosortase A-associated)
MMSDNNDFGLALVMAMPLLFYLAQEEKSLWAKLGAIFLAGWCVLTTFFTQSRGGFVALAVVAVFWLFKFRRKGWALIAAPVLLVLTVLVLPPELIDRGKAVLFGTPDASVDLRIVAWNKALAMAQDRPVYGVGIGNFEALWHEYPPPVDHAPLVTHNTYLQLLAESGAVGVVLFFSLLVTAIAGLRLLRHRYADDSANSWRVNYSHALELSVVGFVIGALFLSRVHFDLLYQLVAVAAALWVAADREESVSDIFLYWRRREPIAAESAGAAVEP